MKLVSSFFLPPHPPVPSSGCFRQTNEINQHFTGLHLSLPRAALTIGSRYFLSSDFLFSRCSSSKKAAGTFWIPAEESAGTSSSLGPQPGRTCKIDELRKIQGYLRFFFLFLKMYRRISNVCLFFFHSSFFFTARISLGTGLMRI